MVDGMNAEQRSFTEAAKSTIWPEQPTFILEMRKAAPSGGCVKTPFVVGEMV